MSRSPAELGDFQYESDYADAARQLNKLVRAGRSYSGHERNGCFLNVEGERFANVSMVSGFDFPDDGRAVALCDWDGDGDQDIWVANRTAPQLRFMRNDLSGHAFVQFHLEGTTSNRDAIGARVRVVLGKDHGNAVLQRTLRAGEGFLACHSKRIHFGLGNAPNIKSVEVRWPSGISEDFGSVTTVNSKWLLKEGSGRLSRVTTTPPSNRTLPRVEVAIPAQTTATLNLLTEPIPTPPLIYSTFNGAEIDATAPRAKPLLINLWASWCQPCLVELTEWTKHAARLKEEVALLAVSVDGLSAESPTDEELQSILEQVGFSGETGKATSQLLDVLQQVHNVIYDHHRPLPVPSSFLLDTEGRLRAIYKGAVTADRVIADARALQSTQTSSGPLPFDGRWLGTQNTHNHDLLVEELFREGYEAEANAYVERLVGERLVSNQVKSRLFLGEQLADRDPTAAIRHLSAAIQVDNGNASAHERLALIFARTGRIGEAMKQFELAINYSRPPNARAHFNYGRLLRQTKAVDRAAEQFTLALGIDPMLVQAHEQLGLILASKQEFSNAAEHFERAAELRPSEPQHKVNLAMAYARLRKDVEVWEVLSHIVQEEDVPPMALLLGAKSLGNLNRYAEAIPLLESFLRIEPGAADVRQQLDLMRVRAKER